MKFAAIDIGSNAVRLLFSDVLKKKNNVSFKKIALYRVPVRLGDDVFTKGKISSEKQQKLLNTMSAFRLLIDVLSPEKIMACATSAMREASNGKRIVEEINKTCNLGLSIISGQEEANIIFSNHFEKYLDANNSYLYIDVGGGSTELTYITKGKISESRSFNIGTIRLLKDSVDHDTWEDMQKWIKPFLKNNPVIYGIGSGGNINKLPRLSNSKEKNQLSYSSIKKIYEMLDSYSYEERIQKFDLKPDRADVILPACKIYLAVMKWAKIKKIYIPEIGLADGMMHIMYEAWKKNE